TDAAGGEIDLAAGAYGTGRASAAWQSGRFASGLALWGRASWQETDGWREHSGVSQRTLFVGGDFRGDTAYVRFFGFSGRERTGLAYYAVEPWVLEANPRANPLQPEETDRFGQDLFYLQVARPVGERAEVAAQVYYSGAQGFLRLFDDPAARSGLAQYGIDGGTLGLLLTARARGESYRFDAGVHGYDFERDHYSFGADGARRYVNTGKKEEIAAFAKLAWDPTPRWTLFGDLQVRHARFRYDGAVDLGPVDWTFVDPKLGVRFAASERWALWASAGTSGREPARNDLLGGEDDVAAPIDLERVRPEHLLDFELGADYRSPGFDLSAVVYAMEFDDEIAATGEQSDLGYAIRRNLHDSYRRGVELEAVARPSPRWRLGAVANLSRNRIAVWRQALDVYDAGYGYSGSELVTVRDTPPALSPETILGASVEWLPKPALLVALSGRWVDAA
ncbi:MAG: TonB-dependent receptor, partial [Thermoanaerobaculia bacterium]|nr:TonB-dependent receptor [Thermoanaerobaculia bacterium]